MHAIRVPTRHAWCCHEGVNRHGGPALQHISRDCADSDEARDADPDLKALDALLAPEWDSADDEAAYGDL